MSATARLSRPAHDAARLLGLQVAQARRERRWPATSLAERAGISPMTLRKVERGDPSVSIGTVFEVATIVGIPLFAPDQRTVQSAIVAATDRLALLPERVRLSPPQVSDDF